MSAVAQLKVLSASAGFPLAAPSRSAAQVLDRDAGVLRDAASDPGFEGRAGDAATALMTQQALRAAASSDELISAAGTIDAANNALARAVQRARSLPSDHVDNGIVAGLLSGGWALFGPAGAMTGAAAVTLAHAVLGNRRERAAIDIIVDLESELAPLAAQLTTATEAIEVPAGGRPAVVPGYPADRDEHDMSPWELGSEWLSGKGNSRDFLEQDAFTQLLRQHPHYDDLRAELHDLAANGQLNVGMSTTGDPLHGIDPTLDIAADYRLSGIDGVEKYIVDYSTLLTGGLTGNLAVTYLGSHNVDLKVIGQNPDGSYEVRFTASNSSSLQSATRPPVIGYDEWYKDSVGAATDWLADTTGFGRTTTQTITWTETIQP